MASSSPISVLEYLRSKSSIDYDSLDFNGATELAPFADCTSNQNPHANSKQWEAYVQLSKPENAAVVQDSVVLARQLQPEFGGVTVEELAVEIAMMKLGLAMIPQISGSIHIMCNPLYAWDTEKVYQTGHRFHRICRILDASFDPSRLVMKVPSTWQGLQACRRLTADKIKTLATTVFTMEQVVLAGEVGCTSVSPFLYELRAHSNPELSYHDSDPIHALVTRAHHYFKHHSIPTKVKACAFMTTDEIISFAGIDAMTIPSDTLAQLAAATELPQRLDERCVLRAAADSRPPERLSYIDDEAKFTRALASNGRGKAKTEDAISVFCCFQIDAEALMAAVKN